MGVIYGSENILPMFSSRSFMVSCLVFKSLIHFEFIFVYGVREVLASPIYMWLFTLPNTTYWRDHLFSIVYFCLLCQRLLDCRCVVTSFYRAFTRKDMSLTSSLNSLCQVMIQWEDSYLWIRKSVLARQGICRCFDLELAASRNGTDKCLLFKHLSP